MKITLKELRQLVKNVIKENENVYGHEEIKKLYSNLGSDEDVQLDDSSGELSGQIKKRKDIVKDRLKRAMKNGNWDEVAQTILYFDKYF